MGAATASNKKDALKPKKPDKLIREINIDDIIIPSSDPDMLPKSVLTEDTSQLGDEIEAGRVEESPVSTSGLKHHKNSPPGEPLYKAILIEGSPGGWGWSWDGGDDDHDEMSHDNHGWGDSDEDGKNHGSKHEKHGWKHEEHGWKHEMDQEHVSLRTNLVVSYNNDMSKQNETFNLNILFFRGGSKSISTAINMVRVG